VHEAKLCLSLLRMAGEAARREGAARIVGVTVAVGAWSGVAAEALRCAFPVCARGTLAEGATLVIEPAPGRELVLRDVEIVGSDESASAAPAAGGNGGTGGAGGGA